MEHLGTKLVPDAGDQTGNVQGPKTYVDRVMEEILDTERTYVQDLHSIVAVRNWSSLFIDLCQQSIED